MKTYAELLRDPRWQKKRLEVLQAAGWLCSSCFDSETELHVHHLRYRWNVKPWEYSNDELKCLCKTCHSAETEAWSMLKDELMLIGVGAKVLVPLVAGYMVGYGFIGPDNELAARAEAIDGEMMRLGRIAAAIEHLPEDLFQDVMAGLDAATAEVNRRMAAFTARINSEGLRIRVNHATNKIQAAPSSKLTPELRELIGRHADEIRAVLGMESKNA